MWVERWRVSEHNFLFIYLPFAWTSALTEIHQPDSISTPGVCEHIAVEIHWVFISTSMP